MKQTATYTFLICILLVLVGLTCRMLWLASRTETGLDTLRLQWRDATWGLVAGSHVPIHSLAPVDQARWWLREVDRVLQAEPGNAQVIMGAALVLDNSSPEYMQSFRKNAKRIPVFGKFVDPKVLVAADDAFESQCNKKCLELAAKATDLDPSNVEWWRLRALMLRRDSWGIDSPRAADWLEILEQASRHDAENALYDYLAADCDWEASGELDTSGHAQMKNGVRTIFLAPFIPMRRGTGLRTCRRNGLPACRLS